MVKKDNSHIVTLKQANADQKCMEDTLKVETESAFDDVINHTENKVGHLPSGADAEFGDSKLYLIWI